jgi:CheY-like chemotaxis protein/signal transduction histidine kinase
MQRAEHDQWKSSEVARLLALVETERRYYQDIFAVLPVAVALADAEWRLVAVNREFRRRFDLQQADFTKMRVPDLIPAPELEAAMGAVQLTGKAVDGLEVVLGEGEGALRLRVSIQKMPGWQIGSEDELLLTVEEKRREAVVAREVRVEASEEEQAAKARAERARIEESKRGAVERLSGRLAHVTNNLLMIIGGYGEELKESLAAGDERRGEVEEILKAAGRLGVLARELTALTRPGVYEEAEFGMGRWMKAMGERLREYGVECGAVERGLIGRASPMLLEQMVFEAARYMRPHLGEEGRLRLEARAAGEGRMEVRLGMLGAAMEEEARERFFEPFAGEKAGPDPPLGLAGLVRPWQALGGSAWLEGDCLVLECKRVAEAGTAEALATVLVVEDEAGIRGLVSRALERQGYRVVEAGAPAEALAKCADLAQAPDLLITDLMVPGMSGGELARRVREEWPETRVLYISGYTSDAELAGQIAEGTLPERTRFLAKPFTTAQLLSEVRALLEIR